MKKSTLLLGLALFIGGCGNAAQQKAYEHAAQMEQQCTAETAPGIIAEYRKVIALEPDSGLAKKSHERIAAVEARVKAEEQRKDVFQEHGID
jgi:hypothetical protein